MIELYTKGKEKYPNKFLKEFKTDEKGRIETSLPGGDYILDVYKKKGTPGAIYHRREFFLEVPPSKEEKIFNLEPAGTILGKIIYNETKKGIPDSTILIAVDTGKEGKEKFMRFHTDMEGNFSCTVPAEKKLKIMGAFEGYKTEEVSDLLHKGEVREVKLVARRK